MGRVSGPVNQETQSRFFGSFHPVLLEGEDAGRHQWYTKSLGRVVEFTGLCTTEHYKVLWTWGHLLALFTHQNQVGTNSSRKFHLRAPCPQACLQPTHHMALLEWHQPWDGVSVTDYAYRHFPGLCIGPINSQSGTLLGKVWTPRNVLGRGKWPNTAFLQNSWTQVNHLILQNFP